MLALVSEHFSKQFRSAVSDKMLFRVGALFTRTINLTSGSVIPSSAIFSID